MFKGIYKFFHRIYHSRYHGIYRHAKKLFVFDLGLMALAVVMLLSGLFFFFWRPTITDLIDISISLGTGRVKSGDHVKVTIDFTNRSKYNLTNTTLALRLPNGFIVDKTLTPPSIFQPDSTFALPKELKPGAKGQAELFGWFWSEPDKEERITASLSYEPAGTNSLEQKSAVFAVTLPDSVLESSLLMPTSSFPNTPVKFTYTLTNTGSQTVNGISIANNWPDKIMEDKDTQNISLPPSGVKVISGSITIPSKSGKYSLEITPQITANNNLIPQAPVRQEIQTFSPDMPSTIEFLNQIQYAEPGQIIPVQVTWQNKSSYKLRNLSLHIGAGLAGVVDWKKTAAENNAKAQPDGILFDGSSRTNLSNGDPGASDSFTENLYLLPSFNLNGAEKAYVEIIPVINAGLPQVSNQNFSQEGTRVRVPLATELFLKSEARYYTTEGDQLGRGPLPPAVGKTTKYWVFINVSNTSNAVDNATFSAVLPAGVELTGKQSVTVGPELQYNSATRKISWAYDYLPANSQTGIYFEVQVTPDSSQLGKNIVLANSIQFSATDDFVNKIFSLSSPAVTNVLNTNDKGRNLGSKVSE